jgi:hypothetical protein
MSEDPDQRDADVEDTVATQRRHEEGAAVNGGGGSVGEEPDVLLDVPVLKVEEIYLEIEGLRAHVAVLAELADLVKLSVAADVNLDRVKLTIKGIEAQALLKVRLEQVRAILDKALTTIGENPEILQSLVRTVDRTLGEVGSAAREAYGRGWRCKPVDRRRRRGDPAGGRRGRTSGGTGWADGEPGRRTSNRSGWAPARVECQRGRSDGATCRRRVRECRRAYLERGWRGVGRGRGRRPLGCRLGRGAPRPGVTQARAYFHRRRT